MNENTFAGRLVRNHKHPGNFEGPIRCGMKVTGKTWFGGRLMKKGSLAEMLKAAKAKIDPRAASEAEIMRNLNG